MADYLIDSETIDTEAGVYEVRWEHETNPERPYNEGFTLLTNGGRDYIDIREGDATSPVSLTVQAAMDDTHRDSVWHYELRSGAAIVRYLQLAGKKGVTLVDERYRPIQASTDRLERIHGVAWAPDDAADWHNPLGHLEYTYRALDEWTAWAEGEAFGWIVLDPAGDEVESVWGYYGQPYGEQRDYTLSEATIVAQADAQRVLDQTSTVGAGIVGRI